MTTRNNSQDPRRLTVIFHLALLFLGHAQRAYCASDRDNEESIDEQQQQHHHRNLTFTKRYYCPPLYDARTNSYYFDSQEAEAAGVVTKPTELGQPYNDTDPFFFTQPTMPNTNVPTHDFMAPLGGTASAQVDTAAYTTTSLARASSVDLPPVRQEPEDVEAQMRRSRMHDAPPPQGQAVLFGDKPAGLETTGNAARLSAESPLISDLFSPLGAPFDVLDDLDMRILSPLLLHAPYDFPGSPIDLSEWAECAQTHVQPLSDSPPNLSNAIVDFPPFGMSPARSPSDNALAAWQQMDTPSKGILPMMMPMPNPHSHADLPYPYQPVPQHLRGPNYDRPFYECYLSQFGAEEHDDYSAPAKKKTKKLARIDALEEHEQVFPDDLSMCMESTMYPAMSPLSLALAPFHVIGKKPKASPSDTSSYECEDLSSDGSRKNLPRKRDRKPPGQKKPTDAAQPKPKRMYTNITLGAPKEPIAPDALNGAGHHVHSAMVSSVKPSAESITTQAPPAEKKRSKYNKKRKNDDLNDNYYYGDGSSVHVGPIVKSPIAGKSQRLRSVMRNSMDRLRAVLQAGGIQEATKMTIAQTLEAAIQHIRMLKRIKRLPTNTMEIVY